jgi:inhibitor of cysteine peptidase
MRKQIFMKFILVAGIFLSAAAFAQVASEPDVAIYTQDRPAVVVNPKLPTFIVKLKSNPTTGYSWFLRDFNTDLLIPVSHKFAPPDDPKLVGAPGFELWTFRMKPPAFIVPQQTLLRFVYTRPWEAADATPVIFKVSTIENTAK